MKRREAIIHRNLPILRDDPRIESAIHIGLQLQRLSSGDDVYDPTTWKRVVHAVDCYYRTIDVPHGDRGLYLPPGLETRGSIVVNIAYPECVQARVLVHELAHHLLHIWEPPLLEHAADFYSYEGDVSEVRHHIAQIAEDMICGLFRAKETH